MRLAAILALFLITTPALAEEETGWHYNGEFHSALSEIEKTTDKIIIDSVALFDFNNKEKNYNLALTEDLIDEIFFAEKKAVKTNCDGSEGLGVDCGLKYNPLICAKYISDIYFYKVASEDDHSAVVYASWREDGDQATIYRLVKDNNEWKIDTIICANGDGFNA